MYVIHCELVFYTHVAFYIYPHVKYKTIDSLEHKRKMSFLYGSKKGVTDIYGQLRKSCRMATYSLFEPILTILSTCHPLLNVWAPKDLYQNAVTRVEKRKISLFRRDIATLSVMLHFSYNSHPPTSLRPLNREKKIININLCII